MDLEKYRIGLLSDLNVDDRPKWTFSGSGYGSAIDAAAELWIRGRISSKQCREICHNEFWLLLKQLPRNLEGGDPLTENDSRLVRAAYRDYLVIDRALDTFESLEHEIVDQFNESGRLSTTLADLDWRQQRKLRWDLIYEESSKLQETVMDSKAPHFLRVYVGPNEQAGRQP
jgi:hypothetical protein